MRNLTVVGKFLILTALLGSITACGTLPQQSASVQRSASVSNEGTSAIMFAFNVFEWSRYSLNEEQKRKQNSAGYAALESDYGTIYKWYEENAKGEFKAVPG